MRHSELEKITKKMLPKTQIKPADLLIVFGTTYGIDLFVENIASLYNNGYCKYILVEKGISKNIVLTEAKSENTGENLQFSLPILEEKFGNVQNIKSIIGVGKIHATLRFLMTMCKYFPDAEKMFYPINPFPCKEKDLYTNKEFCKKLMLEMEKIPKYLQQGFITNIDRKTLLVP